MSSRKRRYAIIVAGGSGTRVGGELPKQFIQLAGRPILAHTITHFLELKGEVEILIVLPSDQKHYWKEYCLKERFIFPHRLVSGGLTRYHSVKSALDKIDGEGIVAIHDGVRPFITSNYLERLYSLAEEREALIPMVELYDSLRVKEGGEWKVTDRDNYRAIQTPQLFQLETIKRAYQLPYSPKFTDDASVVEAAGVALHFTEGEPLNRKITEPSDLEMGEALLSYLLRSSFGG